MADQIAPASPLPWKVKAEDRRGHATVFVMSGAYYVATCHIAPGDLDDSGKDQYSPEANAAHIVQCVNQYPSLVQQRDELLSALKGLLAAVSAIVAADEVKSLDGIVAALPEAKRASDDAIVAVARAEGASHGE